MRQSLDGDKAAYENLLNKTATLVRGYLANCMSRHSRTDEKLEDLVQEVLLAIHRKKHLYRTDMPVLPWLFAVARYKLIDQVRSESRRPKLVDWDDTLDPAAPEASKLSEENALVLEELLADLPPKHKQILILAKAEGLPLAEIAERFQMSLSAVKVTVHRALRKIRAKQADMAGPE